MGDLLGLDSDLSSYFSFLIWSSVASIAVVAIYFIIKTVIKNNNKKKERERMLQDVDMLFNKYSDVLVEKIVNKLNNK